MKVAKSKANVVLRSQEDDPTLLDEGHQVSTWTEGILFFRMPGFINIGGSVAQITMMFNRETFEMKWITRHKIRVNRTATCWLVRRFLDSEAEFLFVPAEDVEKTQAEVGATGFDAPGATYPHRDSSGRCSFAALVHERFPHDHVLLEMARIVQAADFSGKVDEHPAARGLRLISHGFPLVTKDDHETAERAAFVYDALYASIAKRQGPMIQ